MVGVFHRIGVYSPQDFTNPIEQILAFEGTVTFDGIYVSVFEHRGQLAKRKPLLFISGDQIGREGFCNKEQLLELKALGFTLGWHGWSHRRLNEIDDEQKRLELRRPDWVEPMYAYPHGDFDDRSIMALKAYGYERAYSTTQGESDNEYAIIRQYI